MFNRPKAKRLTENLFGVRTRVIYRWSDIIHFFFHSLNLRRYSIWSVHVIYFDFTFVVFGHNAQTFDNKVLEFPIHSRWTWILSNEEKRSKTARHHIRDWKCVVWELIRTAEMRISFEESRRNHISDSYSSNGLFVVLRPCVWAVGMRDIVQREIGSATFVDNSLKFNFWFPSISVQRISYDLSNSNPPTKPSPIQLNEMRTGSGTT